MRCAPCRRPTWYKTAWKWIKKTAIRLNPFPWLWKQFKRTPWFFYGLVIKLWDWVRGFVERWSVACVTKCARCPHPQLFHYVYETIPPKKNKYITAYEKRRRFREDKKWVEENHEQSKLMNIVKADAVANYRVRVARGALISRTRLALTLVLSACQWMQGWSKPQTVAEKKEVAREFLYSYNLELVAPARMFGVNYFTYEHPLWWWEMVSYGLKLSLFGFIALLSDPFVQLAVAIAALLVAIFLQALFNPFKRDSTDVIASVVLLQMLLSLFLALMMVTETGTTGIIDPDAAARADKFASLFVYSNLAVLGVQVLLILLESVVDGQQAESTMFKKQAAKVSRRNVGVNTIIEVPPSEDSSSDTPPPPPEVKVDLTWNRKDVKWRRLRTLQMGMVHSSAFALPERLTTS